MYSIDSSFSNITVHVSTTCYYLLPNLPPNVHPENGDCVMYWKMSSYEERSFQCYWVCMCLCVLENKFFFSFLNFSTDFFFWYIYTYVTMVSAGGNILREKCLKSIRSSSLRSEFQSWRRLYSALSCPVYILLMLINFLWMGYLVKNEPVWKIVYLEFPQTF
jgi:hypothetical protein